MKGRILLLSLARERASMISLFLLFSLLISIVFSAHVLSFKREFNKEVFAKENIKVFLRAPLHF